VTPTDFTVLPSIVSAPAPGVRAAPRSDLLDAARDGLRRLEAALLRPVDAAWLAMFRIFFGLLFAISMERFLAHGWVDDLLVRPSFRFHYWGFEWVEPLSPGGMHALFWILAGLALAVATGAAFRVTAPLFAAGLTYIQLIDVSTYLNHYYLAALIAWLLSISPANRTWSVDAWLRKRFGDPSAAWGPGGDRVAAAWLVLFRVQIGLVYFYAGMAKLQSDWLLHGQPLGIWLGASTHLPILGRIFTIEGVPLVMSWCGFLFDTSIVLWLSWRRTRPFAYAVVLFFHTMTKLLFDIGMFPFIMSTAALVFFEPSWPRSFERFVRRVFGQRTQVTTGAIADGPVRESEPIAPRRARLYRAALVLGALYCVVQLLAPLRCHLYGGNVLWHEQGMRLSWRVMVRAKGGAITFVVREKETGREYHVSPREYLTAYQENEMSSQPDLVLQLAHRIGHDYEARGVPVAVRVESSVSLNGRRGAPMIDPDVDLMTVRDGLAPARWILPAPSEPPPHTRPVP
jgi:hypothetical protein